MKLEFNSSESVYKNLIDGEVDEINFHFDEELYEKVSRFYQGGKQLEVPKLDVSENVKSSKQNSLQNYFSTPLPISYKENIKSSSKEKPTAIENQCE